MIPRLLVVLGVVILVSIATLLPDPLPTAVGLRAAAPTPAPLEASEGNAVASCPWPAADDRRETLVAGATLSPASMAISFPSGGEAGPTEAIELLGPGADLLSVGELLRRGDSPAIVELSAGPSAVAALVEGDEVAAGDLCPASIPKVWQLPGGSTREGERLRLRLFNPFPESASLSVSAVSEFGIEVVPGLEAISVGSRGWRDFDLSGLLPLRERLALQVAIEQGLVVPALILESGDHAVWPGIGRSLTWEFPLVRVGDLAPVLAVSNPGNTLAAVDVDVFTSVEPFTGAWSGSIPPGEELRLDLADVHEGEMAVRVRADAAVSAVLRGSGDQGEGALPGAARQARRWLLPGTGASSGRHSLWLLNSDSQPTTITIRSLGAGGLGEPTKVSLAPGTMRRVAIPGGGAGMLVEGLDPFTVAWSVESESGVAYLAGSPVHDE